jgi:cytochrome P450
MCWAVKLLAEHPIAQSHIRKSLQSAFTTAMSENRLPSIHEITGTSVPYLDAAIEEIFRVSGPVPLGSREATRDTVVLGHAIPKGTTVMYLQNGPSFLMPAGEIDESRRSERSQEDQKRGRHKAWNDDDIASFKPERWLVEAQPDDNGNGNALENPTDKSGSEAAVVFDSNAGPTNPFGLGLRSCFGRRLAYLEFRIMLIILIWNFELLECPKEISDWHGKLGVVYKPRQCFVRLKKVDHL